MGFTDRLKHAWNAFMNRDPTNNYRDLGMSYTTRPDRIRLTGGNERTIVSAIFNRIALDVAAIDIKHVQLDENYRYLSDMDTELNNCLTTEANIDQSGKAFIQDIVMSMFDEGVVAVVPVDTTMNPKMTGGYDITSMRTGKIMQWFPKHVKVRLYNDRTGKPDEIVVPKSMTAIIENPFYSVVNDNNSIAKRLLRKLALLDYVDEQTASGKLNMIVQLPYTIKGEARQKQAEDRYKRIEDQLTNSKYGIAYIDATERVTQLNRALDNNLVSQIENLQKMLFSQLGITQEIMDGTANEQTMTNYYSRTIEPILETIVDEMKRKFLTKTARSQRKTIMYFQDPFKLVATSQIGDIADKLTRNEIMTSNEIRQIVGMKPANDPSADELRNKNLNPSSDYETNPINDPYGDYGESDDEEPDSVMNMPISEFMSS